MGRDKSFRKSRVDRSVVQTPMARKPCRAWAFKSFHAPLALYCFLLRHVAADVSRPASCTFQTSYFEGFSTLFSCLQAEGKAKAPSWKACGKKNRINVGLEVPHI